MEAFDIVGYLLGLAATVGYLRAQMSDLRDDIKEVKARLEDLDDKIK